MATTLKAGDSGELVKRLQAALIAFGYDLGPDGADGGFGDRTEAAVTDFQGSHGLPATGVADPDTIAAMDLDPDTLEDLIKTDPEGGGSSGSSSESPIEMGQERVSADSSSPSSVMFDRPVESRRCGHWGRRCRGLGSGYRSLPSRTDCGVRGQQSGHDRGV